MKIYNILLFYCQKCMAYLNTAFNINVKLKHVVIGLKQIRKKYFFLFSFQDTYFKMGYRMKNDCQDSLNIEQYFKTSFDGYQVSIKKNHYVSNTVKRFSNLLCSTLVFFIKSLEHREYKCLYIQIHI